MSMRPNPVLHQLGLANTDRVVIIHTDDIGMCQASVSAFAKLYDFGLISSGATMVPCPWFLEAARFCREHQGVDMGVHLTLTSEWETYRWGPVSTRDIASGLMDEQGYFPRCVGPVQENADPAAANWEMEGQVKRAIAAGIQPTHIDTHMGTVAHAKFIPGYLGISAQYG
ncbi:MAG: ChbG/HpnK family deacetylase, partial [Anaerolineaceae bacterium]|nr:ChbG/HpnK family deacetylase [Anaerolineaceae bacterium]